ncbi:hypothetical protein AAFF_G00097580 [Aldrovandia affinis]|uniref:Uncharacterized protein n=1 Tax=Aldrovandia affinis TaxID=143900 RepID=A0AAD7RVH2_9TELE|nr:hypothetical protein AAFF_G00097580 [Aldrovandia affinis]
MEMVAVSERAEDSAAVTGSATGCTWLLSLRLLTEQRGPKRSQSLHCHTQLQRHNIPLYCSIQASQRTTARSLAPWLRRRAERSPL